MPRPPKLPRWMTAITAADLTKAVEATEAKKDDGFDDAERISAQALNWLLWSHNEWRAYFDETAGAPVNKHLSAAAGISDGTGGGWSYSVTISGGADPLHWVAGATGGAILSFALPLRRGDRLLEVTAYVKGSASADLFFRLVKTTGAGGGAAQTVIADSVPDTAGAGDQTLSVIGLTETIADLEFVTLLFQGNAGAAPTGARVYALVYRYDRP